MIESPGVSVIIPVFNGEEYLAAAIESVLNQSLPASEIVVVDDGSTDRSAEVASSYGGIVSALSLKHAGVSAAVNVGVGVAKGPLLSFLDADDLWTPRKIESQVAAFLSPDPPDMAFGFAQNFSVTGGVEPAQPGISRGTLLIAKERWVGVGPLDESLVVGEFVDWFARAREAGLRFICIDDVLLRRRVHGSNSGIRSAASRSQYALVAKRALDRRRQKATS